MAEDTEIPGQATPPSLSESFIRHQEGLIAELEAKHPQHAALLRASLDQAKAATGYTPPPSDDRSEAQKLTDRQFGVEPRRPEEYSFDRPPPGWEDTEEVTAADVQEGVAEMASALSMQPALAKAIADDILRNGAADKAEVAATLGRMNRNYSEVVKAVQGMLNRVPENTIDASDLPAYSLVQLHTWAEHTKRHAQSRPKS